MPQHRCRLSTENSLFCLCVFRVCCRRLMFQTPFQSNYTSFDSTGATFITQHTNIKLVGIDYLSIGCLEDIVETHRILLGKVGR